MVGSTGKIYGEEFKLMILEMHKKGKTIRELSSEYMISPHTISYWKNQKKREMKDQAEEIEIFKKVYAILMKK